MSTLAGIVLYNPDLKRLKENIKAIEKQVDEVILFDNGSKNIDLIEQEINFDFTVTLEKSAKNLGIAAALNRIMEYALKKQYRWVLTLDQDSVCESELIENYYKYTELDKIGILTCNIKDRNFESKAKCASNENYTEIKTCITSASFMNVDAFKNTSGFDEIMFIDSVDFDMCIKLRKAGYRIIRINYDGILHEVGHGKNVHILKKNYEIYNHNPWRHYYMARNQFYLLQKYTDEFNLWKVILREIRIELLILLYEKQKMKKIFSRWKGIKDSKMFKTSSERRLI